MKTITDVEQREKAKKCEKAAREALEAQAISMLRDPHYMRYGTDEVNEDFVRSLPSETLQGMIEQYLNE